MGFLPFGVPRFRQGTDTRAIFHRDTFVLSALSIYPLEAYKTTALFLQNHLCRCGMVCIKNSCWRFRLYHLLPLKLNGQPSKDFHRLHRTHNTTLHLVALFGIVLQGLFGSSLLFWDNILVFSCSILTAKGHHGRFSVSCDRHASRVVLSNDDLSGTCSTPNLRLGGKE